MKSKNLFIFILAVLGVVVCSAVPAQSNIGDRRETRVYIDDANAIHYDGPLSPEANKNLFQLYTEAEIKPGMLIISSIGGNVQLGMDVGEWVHANSLDVTVDKGCVSSCANYIFPAGRNKYLYRHSILIWHGGAHQKGLDERSSDVGFTPILQEWRDREDRFFELIEVDSSITVYGQDKYSMLNYAWAYITRRQIAGFDYSLEDLARFGISNVHLLDNEWNWREYNDRFYVVRVEVEG